MDYRYGTPPNRAPSEIMRRIKGRTSTRRFEIFPELKKRYWGRHFWARGYFCVTSGEVTAERIRNYLEHHFDAQDRLQLPNRMNNGSIDPYPDFQSVTSTHQL